jgi:hypothetical protein
MAGFGTNCRIFGFYTQSNDHHPCHYSYLKGKCFYERYYVVEDTLHYVTGSINLSFDLCTCSELEVFFIICCVLLMSASAIL